MRRLTVFAALAFVTLMGSIYFADSSGRSRALAQAQRELATRAQIVADSLDRVLQSRLTQTFTFAALPSMRGFAASDESARAGRAAIAQTELQAIVAADANVRAAMIVDATGKVILATDSSIGSSLGERAFVRESLVGHLNASPPARDFGEISQFYSAPILDNGGNVAAALVLRVAAQEMWSVLNSVSSAFVVDEYGVRIADRSPQIFSSIAPISPQDNARAVAEKRYGAELVQIRLANLPELARAMKDARAASVVFRDSDNRTMRAAIQPIKTKSWIVVVSESEESTNVSSSLADLITASALAAIVGAGWGYAVANFFARGE